MSSQIFISGHGSSSDAMNLEPYSHLDLKALHTMHGSQQSQEELGAPAAREDLKKGPGTVAEGLEPGSHEEDVLLGLNSGNHHFVYSNKSQPDSMTIGNYPTSNGDGEGMMMGGSGMAHNDIYSPYLPKRFDLQDSVELVPIHVLPNNNQVIHPSLVRMEEVYQGSHDLSPRILQQHQCKKHKSQNGAAIDRNSFTLRNCMPFRAAKNNTGGKIKKVQNNQYQHYRGMPTYHHQGQNMCRLQNSLSEMDSSYDPFEHAHLQSLHANHPSLYPHHIPYPPLTPVPTITRHPYSGGLGCGTRILDESLLMNKRGEKMGNSIKHDSIPKTRWKPNAVQLSVLEQHFNSGYTKATPELHAIVQGAGPATENQVTVWLKNRLSRCKRLPVKKTKEDDYLEAESENEVPWEDFKEVSNTVLGELSMIVSTVPKEDAVMLAKAIKAARRICCYGVSREGLTMKAFASSLYHLGFECYCIGDVNMPKFGEDDLVLVSAGPSFYCSVNALALEAMRTGSKVIAFTAHKTANISFAEIVIRIPSQTLTPDISSNSRHVEADAQPKAPEFMSFLPDGRISSLHMGSSFEMSLYLLFECVSIMLRRNCSVSAAEMRARHTNLE